MFGRFKALARFKALLFSASLAALLVGVGSAGIAAAAGSPREDEARGGSRIAGSYIAVYRPSVESVGRKTDQLEREVGFSDDLRYRHALEGFSAELSPREARELEAEPAVVSVEPDRLVEASASVPLATSEPTPPPGVRRIEAATSSTVREASSVNVAVIDTGIQLTHPDLNAAAGKNCVNTSAAPNDDNGHGTHVAGTIAAKNNGAGVVGVAPGTKVYAVKVLNSSGSGSWSQIICGIDSVTGTRTDTDPNNDIAVANMSLGGSGSSSDNQPCGSTTALHQAICNSTAAGVNYAVAAGNDAWEFPHPTAPDVPASYDEVVTVTAITDTDGQPGAAGSGPSCRSGEADDRYASFSNYSDNAADNAHTVAAPGVCVNSTWLSGGYRTISGTSMATPHVAGLVALCLGEGGASGPCTGLTPDQIVAKMNCDAEARTTGNPGYGFNGDPFQPVSGRYYGYLSWALVGPGCPPPPDTKPPSALSTSPAGGATGVATGAPVRVTFSEPMDKASVEGAFSLAPTADPAATVAGSFSWSGNEMTFQPFVALEQGTGYTATVSTGARDVAQNQLAAEKTWSFKTLRSVVQFPTKTRIESGSLVQGSTVSNLGADDDFYYGVKSTTSTTRTASWYGTITGVPNSASNLKVSYQGKNDRDCTQGLYIRRFSNSTWVQLDSQIVGTSEVLVEPPLLSGSAADYVSGSTGNGEVRVRVRCTTTNGSGSFVASGDLMKIAYNAP